MEPILILLIFFFFYYFYVGKEKIENFNPNFDFQKRRIRENEIINNILNKLFVKSGGMGEYSSKSSFIKFNDKVVVKRGSNGMNIAIIERSDKMKIKNLVNINTGLDYLQNDTMIDLIQNHIERTDIVVISVKRDAFRLMNTECRFHLKKLGSKLNLTRGNASYILIGSRDKKIYYEKISWTEDVFFPHIVYHDLGCWKMDSSIIVKKIRLFENTSHNEELEKYTKDFKDISKYSNTENNDTEEYIEFTNKYNLVKSCSMKALSNGTRKFAVTKNYCYLFGKNSDYTRLGSGYWCSNLSAHGIGNKKSNEYTVYQIDDVFVQDYEINENPQTYVRVYHEENYKYNRIILEPGIYTDRYFNGIELQGGLVWSNIKSIKIPDNFMVIIADDHNFRRAIRYYLIGPKQIPSFQNYMMNGPIKKIIVLNVMHKVVFFAREYFSGYSYSLSYGSYIVPKEFQYTINSISIKIPSCRISMFFDINFSDLYGVIENKSLDVKDILYMDNDRVIKSIIIEHIDY